MKIKVEMGDTNEREATLEPAAAPIEPAWAEERDRILNEKAELEDLLRRRQAEFENFRKRVERERGETYEDATASTVAKLLPVVDDFERALTLAPAGEGPGAEYAKGIVLIHQQLMETLGKMGLKSLETAGTEFDPNLHHAVQKVEVPGADIETVLEQYQRGYLFKEKLLRPAMVKVGVKG
jgi:molecular chaperone GrpE